MIRIDLLNMDGQETARDVPVDKLSGKTLLITGSSGIVGTHLLFSLRHMRNAFGIPLKVLALVNGTVPEHFSELLREDFITFLIGDLSDDSFVSTLPRADIIVHAATYGQPALFMKNPEVTLRLNTTLTLNLLERVLKNNGRFLFLSSSEVYSGLPKSPFFEDQIGTTTPTHSRACYIEAKRCGEAIVNVYRQKGVNATSARLSLAYGTGTRCGDRRVLNNFIEKALVEKEIRMLDRGKARRSYCYVTDAVNMMWRILLEGTQCVYNIAGVSTVTIADLANLVGKIVGVTTVFPDDSGSGLCDAPEDVRLDITRFISEFGSREFISLETGLRRTIDWQRSLYLSS